MSVTTLTKRGDDVVALPRADGEWRPILPVPDGVPEFTLEAITHPFGGGSLSDIHWYVDQGGRRLFAVLRLIKHDGTKEIRPAAYAEGRDGARCWRPMLPLPPRPLYKLDELTHRPDAPLLVVEGEKAADAASRLFPDHVATTTVGGAAAAHLADWSVIAGRRLVVWPDHDAPGRVYAEEVIRSAFAAGAVEVGIVELPPELPEAWDLADPPPDALTVDDLRALAEQASPQPHYVSHGRFEMSSRGLFANRQGQVGAKWISDPFEIIGRGRNPAGAGWARFLQFHDSDGRLHSYPAADAALHASPAELAAELADLGLRIATGQAERRLLLEYLNCADVPQRITTVSRTGWQEVRSVSVFALPDQTIGTVPNEIVRLVGGPAVSSSRCGSLRDWQAGVAALVHGHSRLMLYVAAALAGPLLRPLGREGGGFHLFGRSSRGKSTTLKAAASVWGSPQTGQMVRSWRATANAVEATAALHSDTVLALDEIGAADHRDLGATIYQLASGVGKSRSRRDGGLRQPADWRTIILSTGECPLGDRLAEGHQAARAGHTVRLVDVPADADPEAGVFDGPIDYDDPKHLADKIIAASQAHHGTAGPAFVAGLLDSGMEEILSFVNEVLGRFADEVIQDGADAQIMRVADRFALAAAAGELAITRAILPWSENDAFSAAATCFEAWLQQRGGIECDEEQKAIKRVRHFIERYGESRFQSLDDPVPRPSTPRAGYRHTYQGECEWLILPEIWRQEVCGGMDSRLVAHVLAARGYLRRPADGNQVKFRVPEGNLRFYAVRARLLED